MRDHTRAASTSGAPHDQSWTWSSAARADRHVWPGTSHACAIGLEVAGSVEQARRDPLRPGDLRWQTCPDAPQGGNTFRIFCGSRIRSGRGQVRSGTGELRSGSREPRSGSREPRSGTGQTTSGRRQLRSGKGQLRPGRGSADLGGANLDLGRGSANLPAAKLDPEAATLRVGPARSRAAAGSDDAAPPVRLQSPA